ncbi:hypothetical protein H7I92_12005 [Mycobacterium riyadhense]|nr:hypothetical protein [Mycobacterium riyadhense]
MLIALVAAMAMYMVTWYDNPISARYIGVHRAG